MALPLKLVESEIEEQKYRKVYIQGRFDHEKEMKVGPISRDGNSGYLLVTPFIREDGSRILVQRGWISYNFIDKRKRPESLDTSETTLLALYNMFTPEAKPEENLWFIVDPKKMGEYAGTQPFVFEEIYKNSDEMLNEKSLMRNGIPVPSPSSIDIPNDHLQYMLTWFSLCAATSVMFYLSVKRPRTATDTISALRRKAGNSL
ncbi:hypothetical protein BB559_003842 [Furculomyces boomerangus]|uniref:SURF1-like protein n=1 Tax=Furculomyces boomerangus TaxID=61424 RepID=A0A2T9YIG3_9FUNG|nr:hypothetical protein BB559_003842 [Furculomyces boomerangus]